MNLTDSRIFITGVSGFIGEQLALALSLKGAKITGMYHSNFPQRLANNPSIKLLSGNLADEKWLTQYVQGHDYVFHLAAFAKVWSKNPKTPFQVNVEGTKNILEACISTGIKKLVCTSTAGTFGPMQNGQLVTEDTVRDTDFFTSYEETKAQANDLVKQACFNHNLNACIVSPTRVFGPGELSQSNAMTKLIRNYANGMFRFVPGDGNGMGNYVYVNDVVAGMILALEHGKAGENYLLGAYNLSYRDFFDTVGLVYGKKYRLFGFPISGLLTFGKLNELFTQLTQKPPLITTPWIKRYLHDWGVNNTKAKNELNFTPIPLEDAISETLVWLRKEREIKWKKKRI